MTAAVTLDRVSVRFGDFTAVEDATLDIAPGVFFSFLGPSGCGKTTLLRTISGFVDPTAGRVLLAGAAMRGIGPNQRRTEDRRVGIEVVNTCVYGWYATQ